ncbi:hypothetical protein M758_11G011300 [Ceratodon purpureus]|uniref:Uncharacterized protein n=1 Tax=Ceratodon purpureus TaxID=3225 RepID=A0A8T0GB31_CERPU|nr:hypothetical protein KC19_11G012500 [Ceratodon purpureus]KAG0600153.1 hypothetical protein M758_11G011300 [Ceratodon purpureus]
MQSRLPTMFPLQLHCNIHVLGLALVLSSSMSSGQWTWAQGTGQTWNTSSFRTDL